MAGDPTQTQSRRRRAEPTALPEWCVVTADGALRITPGLIVGEGASGALNFNPPDREHQWIEFGFAADGSPWMHVVRDDKSLRVAGSACRRHPLRLGMTIRLPNHTLYVSRDIRMPRRAGAVIEVVRGSRLERLRAAAGRRPVAVAALAAVAVLTITAALRLPMERVPRPGAEAAPVITPTGLDLAAASPSPTPTPTPTSTRAPPPTLNPNRDPDPDPRPDAATAVPESEATRPPAELPTPIVLPPMARRALPAAPPDPQALPPVADPNPPSPPAPATPPDSVSRSDAARVAPAPAARLRREQDLLAADLALAQGRLTFPPEANAYALYHRVLAVDPASPEALSGLQAVRQELINRALAQLAGNDLEGSRRTLRAAADAGADEQLVADLRDEVDYRQRRLETR